MSQTERIFRLRQLLDAGRCVDKREVLQQLGISPATFKRDLAYLQDRLNTPVRFDRQQRGYRLERAAQLPGTQYELPGLWLSAEEIHALLTMQHLLANLDAGGLLGPHIAPLMGRLNLLLGAGAGAKASAELAQRIRVQTVGARRLHVPHFQAVGSALLRRQRLSLQYQGRGRNEVQEQLREVSPQRLIHYRSNWYLDAWCHWREGLRSFALDAIQSVQVLDRAAIDVSTAELDAVLGVGYGIFSGRELQWATLRFTPERARWVAAEAWHPKQRGRFEPGGSYLLELPYADPRELVMDILRHLPEVEVLGPASLAEEVEKKIRAALKNIEAGSAGEPGA
ncbi:WYL domain-containing protein [Roseateles sp.]|uniref:helix-turn-helix transcriptional regulator n=1 Tax=Roseateles sp. TaxID=1971397 RepID=UPI00286B52A2|nr:WYL domain-containing protein [Roseateles sp.]